MSEDLSPTSGTYISLGDARQAFLDIGLKATVVESRTSEDAQRKCDRYDKVEDFFNGLATRSRTPS